MTAHQGNLFTSKQQPGIEVLGMQDLLRQQMRLAYRTGDQDRANKIMDRLRPDEQKEKLTQRMFEEGGQPLA